MQIRYIDIHQRTGTYHAFEYLPGLILPILCKWVTCLTFGFLFHCSAPRNLDVSQFEVRVQDYGSQGVIQDSRSPKLKERRTESDYIRRLFIEPRIVLGQLSKAIVNRRSIGRKAVVIPLGFPGGLEFFDCGQSSP